MVITTAQLHSTKSEFKLCIFCIFCLWHVGGLSYRGTGVPGYRGTGYRGARVPGYQGTGLPGYRVTVTGLPGYRVTGLSGYRGYRGTGVPGYRVTGWPGYVFEIHFRSFFVVCSLGLVEFKISNHLVRHKLFLYGSCFWFMGYEYLVEICLFV